MSDINSEQDRAHRNSKRTLAGLVVVAILSAIALALVAWKRYG
jgi:hypothetical protein